LGRAYNNETKGSGRILSGGLDSKVLAKPKAFFGSARNVEGGGSLTIVATALIDTGSKMDQVIFEEFKGTGNAEIVLSRQLANNRVWPAIDISASGTRKEEKLLHPDEYERISMLRRVLNQMNPNDTMTLLSEKLNKTASNAEFLMQFSVSATA
jgi:transcription termination factor Rho